MERLNLGFERFAEGLEHGLQASSADDLADSMLIDEVKVGCSLAMQFARRSTWFQKARALVRQVDDARWALEVHRTSEPGSSSIDFSKRLLDAIDPSPLPPRGSA